MSATFGDVLIIKNVQANAVGLNMEITGLSGVFSGLNYACQICRSDSTVFLLYPLRSLPCSQKSLKFRARDVGATEALPHVVHQPAGEAHGGNGVGG